MILDFDFRTPSDWISVGLMLLAILIICTTLIAAVYHTKRMNTLENTCKFNNLRVADIRINRFVLCIDDKSITYSPYDLPQPPKDK